MDCLFRRIVLAQYPGGNSNRFKKIIVIKMPKLYAHREPKVGNILFRRNAQNIIVRVETFRGDDIYFNKIAVVFHRQCARAGQPSP